MYSSTGWSRCSSPTCLAPRPSPSPPPPRAWPTDGSERRVPPMRPCRASQCATVTAPSCAGPLFPALLADWRARRLVPRSCLVLVDTCNSYYVDTLLSPAVCNGVPAGRRALRVEQHRRHPQRRHQTSPPPPQPARVAALVPTRTQPPARRPRYSLAGDVTRRFAVQQRTQHCLLPSRAVVQLLFVLASPLTDTPAFVRACTTGCDYSAGPRSHTGKEVERAAKTLRAAAPQHRSSPRARQSKRRVRVQGMLACCSSLAAFAGLGWLDETSLSRTARRRRGLRNMSPASFRCCR